MNFDDQDQDNAFAAVAGITAIVSEAIVWVGTGWLLWKWLGVDSFIQGLIWLFLWAVVSVFAHVILVPLISIPLVMILSLLTGRKL